ncbi:helix-turn-helix transcriptional regulator [Sessilibacter corallicola]|uniref:helix-turn-helix transcriptional regulator n=1 Tax=Sessilibacter corallicola TaxID=2904075 RepID=UPI001E622410|nr:helix-turn-helix transcriptional regulator [Sessilibacter corallicola]
MDKNKAVFTQWNESVAELIDNTGNEALPKLLVNAINELVTIEAVMLVLERRDKSPVLIYDRGIPDEERALYIDAYFSGAYLLDPLCLFTEDQITPGVYPLSEIAPDDFYQSDYFKTYYQETSLIDDVYFIVGPKEDVNFSFAVGRHHDQPKFSEQDLLLFRSINPVVQAILNQYWCRVWEKKTLPESSNEPLRAEVEAAFNNFGASVLTDREREVAHLLLKGHSSKSAAQKLGIAPDTVQMHRKNMYAKLDISSQSELFSLFIEALSTAGSQTDADPLVAYMQPGEN